MKFPLRKAVFTAMLIGILFAQEEVLMLIPNIQLTTLLLVVYGAVCGPYYGTIIVIAHAFLDNLFVGTMIPIVMIPMFIGWEIMMLLGYFSRKSPLWLICILGAVGSLAYCWIFVLTNALFLDIDINAYIIADIPFEVIMSVCTVVTIMFMYRPIVKILSKYWDKKEKIKETVEEKEEEPLS